MGFYLLGGAVNRREAWQNPMNLAVVVTTSGVTQGLCPRGLHCGQRGCALRDNGLGQSVVCDRLEAE